MGELLEKCEKLLYSDNPSNVNMALQLIKGCKLKVLEDKVLDFIRSCVTASLLYKRIVLSYHDSIRFAVITQPKYFTYKNEQGMVAQVHPPLFRNITPVLTYSDYNLDTLIENFDKFSDVFIYANQYKGVKDHTVLIIDIQLMNDFFRSSSFNTHVSIHLKDYLYYYIEAMSYIFGIRDIEFHINNIHYTDSINTLFSTMEAVSIPLINLKIATYGKHRNLLGCPIKLDAPLNVKSLTLSLASLSYISSSYLHENTEVLNFESITDTLTYNFINSFQDEQAMYSFFFYGIYNIINRKPNIKINFYITVSDSWSSGNLEAQMNGTYIDIRRVISLLLMNTKVIKITKASAVIKDFNTPPVMTDEEVSLSKIVTFIINGVPVVFSQR